MGPFVYKKGAVQALIGKPVFGSGTCVDLIKGVIDELSKVSTSQWVPGKSILELKQGDIAPGTAMATFLCGRYPQDGTTGKHAVLFLRFMGAPNPDGTYNEAKVIEQWHGLGVVKVRTLVKKGKVGQACTGGIYDASNTLDAFHVILTR